MNVVKRFAVKPKSDLLIRFKPLISIPRKIRINTSGILVFLKIISAKYPMNIIPARAAKRVITSAILFCVGFSI